MDATILVFVFGIVLTCITCYGDERYRCPKTVRINNYLKTFGDYCFEFIPREKSWNGAHNDCRKRGGHLIVIQDRGTQEFVSSTLRYLRWPGNGVWIGASDQLREMDWRWVTGESVRSGYSNWASGQPSCHFLCFEDCALLRHDEGGKWHDYKCSWIEDYSYICQYRMLPRTTTATTTTTTTNSTTSTVSTTVSTSISTSKATGPSVSTLPLDTGVTNMSDGTTSAFRFQPAINVELYEGAHESQMQRSDGHHGLGTGAMAGLILGLVFGICVGLFLGVIILRYRKKKSKEDLPSVVFANPYYGNVQSAVRRCTRDDSLADCCYGQLTSENSTPVRLPPNISHDRMDHSFDCSPTSATAELIPKQMMESFGQYDEIKPKFVGDWVSGLEVYEWPTDEQGMMWDSHYDYTTGENFYESVDNIRQANTDH